MSVSTNIPLVDASDNLNDEKLQSVAAYQNPVTSVPDVTANPQLQKISQEKVPGEVPFIDKLIKDGNLDKDRVVQLLTLGQPKNIVQYSEHIFKLVSILHEHEHLSTEQFDKLKTKVLELFDKFDTYVTQNDPILSKLYLIVEKNFDILIKVSVDTVSLDLSTKAIRFLTEVIMALNYWEIYNLLTWKPAIYHFLTVIEFDLNECYSKFVKDYKDFDHERKPIHFNPLNVGKRHKRLIDSFMNESIDDDGEDNESVDSGKDGADGVKTPNNGRNNSMVSSESPNSYYDGHSLIMEAMDGSGEMLGEDGGELIVQHIGHTSQLVKATGDRLKMGGPNKFINNDMKTFKGFKVAKKTIKRSVPRTNKSSNYDPDVIHECQLASADEIGKMCLRRFSRKYELIRHQETVHSKKKKLFKCFVCVKQNPGIGPRIFTRHDTLAKHIRVNHKISGKEAKSEVAFSKKHAEIVDEGDITVHVGRRKTKVDFELRAHMERKRGSDGEPEYSDGELDGIVVDEEDESMDEDSTHGGMDSSMVGDVSEVNAGRSLSNESSYGVFNGQQLQRTTHGSPPQGSPPQLQGYPLRPPQLNQPFFLEQHSMTHGHPESSSQGQPTPGSSSQGQPTPGTSSQVPTGHGSSSQVPTVHGTSFPGVPTQSGGFTPVQATSQPPISSQGPGSSSAVPQSPPVTGPPSIPTSQSQTSQTQSQSQIPHPTPPQHFPSQIPISEPNESAKSPAIKVEPTTVASQPTTSQVSESLAESEIAYVTQPPNSFLEFEQKQKAAKK